MLLCFLNALDVTLTLRVLQVLFCHWVWLLMPCYYICPYTEEITAGHSVRIAINTGFKKATSAIVDGNVTTLIAAAVLYLMGTGTIRGFATTLALGIVLSMFTAMVITRILINGFYAMGLRGEKLYGRQKERKPFNFIGHKKVFFAISIIVIAAAQQQWLSTA